MTATEIENAIQRLPLTEFDSLMSWLDEYRETLWDEQIENDLKTGRLDTVLAEVDAERNAGLSTPL